MCGIAGAFDVDADRAVRRVAAINQCQQHRGPDHTAMVNTAPFALGNTRLAIQDMTPAGNQPFISTDGRYVCVFNGELYNYRELIVEFRLDVHSECDGAVIPALWARLGPGCLRRLRGMYAIGLVDTTTHTLTLCRDPFGIKPLYVRRYDDGTMTFGSEVRPLAAIDHLPRLNGESVARYLHLGAMPADVSPFEGIAAVAPNSVLTIDCDGRETVSAILPGPHPLISEGSGGDARPDLGRTLRESVALHLRSDVPVALLLSSGVDSAAIASAARQGGYELHCLTVAGTGDSDESLAAASTAAHYKHEHEVVPARLGPEDVGAYFSAMQRPTIDGLNTFVVCRAVRARGYRVALSGLGADEAMGGYSHFRFLRLLRLLRVTDRSPALASSIRAIGQQANRRLAAGKLDRMLGPRGPRTAWDLDLLQREVYSPADVQEMTGFDVMANSRQRLDTSTSYGSLVEAELANYMQGTLLADADTFSMCSSVELRVPFVDRSFFLAAVAANRGRWKRPSKRALGRSLNDRYLVELCTRRKRGFSVPMATWLTDGPLRMSVEALRDDDAPIWNVVRRDAPSLPADLTPGTGWSQLWSLASLNQWLGSLGGSET